MRNWLNASFAVAAALVAADADAVTIDFSPAAFQVSPGDAVVLDLRISGLGAGAAPSLGSFDVDVEFDPAVLAFDGYSIGTDLGDPVLFEALDFSLGEFLPGFVDIAVVSLLDPAFLVLNQPAEFVLATLSFSVLAILPGEISLVGVTEPFSDPLFALGDELGSSLAPDAIGMARLVGRAAAVPEPGMGVVLLVAVLSGAIAGRLRRNRFQSAA